MKKIWGWIAGVVVVVLVGAYIIFNQSNGAAAPVATTGTDTTGGTTSAPSETTNPAAATTTDTTGGATPTPTPAATTGAYKDGTYTGPVSDAVYGKIQVIVTISGGKITDVAWPVFPNSPGHTTEVSASALPVLKQETITAQSANFDTVSGATQTSQGFQASLSAALTQAQA